MKLLALVLFTAAYVVLLAAVYLVHINFFSVQVIFYSAVMDALIAAGLTAVLMLAFRARLNFTATEVLLLLLVWVLGGYAFAISGPTVLDRSLSFYILEKLQQRGGGIRQDAMERVFVEEYMPEFRLIDVRLTEQLESGTIEIVDGCVRLTERGKRLATLSSMLRRNFLAKHRLLAGVYTDALVDPFSKSKAGPQGYECK